MIRSGQLPPEQRCIAARQAGLVLSPNTNGSDRMDSSAASAHGHTQRPAESRIIAASAAILDRGVRGGRPDGTSRGMIRRVSKDDPCATDVDQSSQWRKVQGRNALCSRKSTVPVAAGSHPRVGSRWRLQLWQRRRRLARLAPAGRHITGGLPHPEPADIPPRLSLRARHEGQWQGNSGTTFSNACPRMTNVSFHFSSCAHVLHAVRVAAVGVWRPSCGSCGPRFRGAGTGPDRATGSEREAQTETPGRAAEETAHTRQRATMEMQKNRT